jgi:hypothetical protein
VDPPSRRRRGGHAPRRPERRQLITGALSGSYDFAFAGYIRSIVARAKGLPITIVAANDLGAKDAEDGRADDERRVVTRGRLSRSSARAR